MRYWAALGVLMREKAGLDAVRDVVIGALKDRSPYVRIVAAETLGGFGAEADLKEALRP